MWEYDDGEKVQRQDYFQATKLPTLAAYISATDQQRTYVGWQCEKYALLTEIICHFYSYIAVHFLEMFFIVCNYL